MSTQSRLQRMYHGQPYARVDFPPRLGLKIWPLRSLFYRVRSGPITVELFKPFWKNLIFVCFTLYEQRFLFLFFFLFLFISICRYVTAKVICAKHGILFLQILYRNALHLVQIIFVLCKELSAQYCTSFTYKKIKKW
jgi:hypothetical protein